jgi:hypothetical protein
MPTCNLNLEDIRYVLSKLVLQWNHPLIKKKWNELKSTYTPEEIIRVLNENVEKDIIISIIKILYKEIKDTNECVTELNNLINSLNIERKELTRQLSIQKDDKKERRFNYIKELIRKTKTLLPTKTHTNDLLKKMTLKSPFSGFKMPEFNFKKTKKLNRTFEEPINETKLERDRYRYRGRDRDRDRGRDGSRDGDIGRGREQSRVRKKEKEKKREKETKKETLLPSRVVNTSKIVSRTSPDIKTTITTKKEKEFKYKDCDKNRDDERCKQYYKICKADKYNPECQYCQRDHYNTTNTAKCLIRASQNVDCLKTENLYNPYCSICLSEKLPDAAKSNPPTTCDIERSKYKDYLSVSASVGAHPPSRTPPSPARTSARTSQPPDISDRIKKLVEDAYKQIINNELYCSTSEIAGITNKNRLYPIKIKGSIYYRTGGIDDCT